MLSLFLLLLLLYSLLHYSWSSTCVISVCWTEYSAPVDINILLWRET